MAGVSAFSLSGRLNRIVATPPSTEYLISCSSLIPLPDLARALLVRPLSTGPEAEGTPKLGDLSKIGLNPTRLSVAFRPNCQNEFLQLDGFPGDVVRQ